MNCENCVHFDVFDVCDAFEKNQQVYKIPASQCGFYKEKFKGHEPQCTIGDCVYISNGVVVRKYVISEISFWGFLWSYICEKPKSCINEQKYEFTDAEINMTVFLTREAAEQRLTSDKALIVKCKDCKNYHKNIGYCNLHGDYSDKDDSCRCGFKG